MAVGAIALSGLFVGANTSSASVVPPIPVDMTLFTEVINGKCPTGFKLKVQVKTRTVNWQMANGSVSKKTVEKGTKVCVYKPISTAIARTSGTGSADLYEESGGVSATSDGGAIVAGQFEGKVRFGSTTLTSNSGFGPESMFVGKISSAGIWVWATRAGGSGFATGRDVAVTPDGGAIVVGEFEGKVTFGSTTLTSSKNRRGAFVEDVFVAKVSSAGIWVWATGDGGSGFATGRDVVVTPDGGAIITGGFVRKISSAGVWEWTTKVGSAGQDYGSGVSVTSDGGAIVTGYFNGTATFGSTTLTSSGEDDVFVGKISADGVWIWVVQAGSTSGDDGFGVGVTSDGGAFVTGHFNGTATFGSTTLTSSGNEDVFVGKISPAGVWEWVTQVGGTYWVEIGSGVAVTSDGGAIITGWFYDKVRFGKKMLTAIGIDAFVGKVSPAGVWVWTTQTNGLEHTHANYTKVSVTSDGGAFIIGGILGTKRFGSTVVTSGGMYGDVFVAKISSAGVWKS